MIHLIIREPVEYQKALCRALEEAYEGRFVAWFASQRPALSNSDETYVSRFFPEVGYLRLFRELKADTQPVVILGGWSSTFAWLTLLITTVLRVPVFIWADHPFPRARRNSLRRIYLRVLNRRVAGVLACGKPTADHLASLGFERKKITNFPYWVRIAREWSVPPSCEAQPEHPIRLLAVGRFVSVKRLDVAIRAVALANEKARREIAKLEVIGEGIERSQLEALAGRLGIQESVRFSGWLSNDEVRCRMSESDALIVPSDFEPYGVVVLEALAHGRPVLASDLVVAALDRDNEKGAILFHSAGDCEALGRQITMLAGDRSVLREAAHAAREIAEQWKPERSALILNSAIEAAHKTSESAPALESGFQIDRP